MDMVNANGEHVNELFQAQAHVLNHIFNFINSMSRKCAIDLGIPDIIQNHGKPMTITELVAALPILNPTKACNIYRLMRILVHSGFFAQRNLCNDAQEDGYVLTNASRLLHNDNPLSVTPFLKAMLNPILTEPWHYILGLCRHDQKLNSLFNEGMASDARLVNSILIDKCKKVFERLNSLVDVGGGTGTLTKAIVDAFPHLECIVLDLPHVVANLQDSGNLKYVAGDMFKEVPASDAILLKEAISRQNKKGGKVMIIDMVLMKNEKMNGEAFNSTETQLFFDMLMMVLVTGKERQEEEWAKLFFAAGFSSYKITPILGLRSLIQVFP
ncbi:hypothetical protein ES332_A10G238100v1 [Gossypium tomentosum]|uniref:O-methyltransferase domain-containing protein n=1 Tax=Gossypium tomentosum TaxID=34277 RepID=A0A5D2NTZ6_GOSTO|nr:hypothetical protein ES332_A10G238100v1 [Gossypium tomentosum]